jgi:hypothetical protein
MSREGLTWRWGLATGGLRNEIPGRWGLATGIRPGGYPAGWVSGPVLGPGLTWHPDIRILFLSETLYSASIVLEANRYPHRRWWDGSYTMACAWGLGRKGARGESCVKGGRNRSCPPTYGNKNQLGYKHSTNMGHAYDHTALRRHATNNPSFFFCVWVLTRGRIDKDTTYVFEKCMLMFLKMYVDVFKNIVWCFLTLMFIFLKTYVHLSENICSSFLTLMLTSDKMYVNVSWHIVWCLVVLKKFSPITEESATSTSDLLGMYVHTRVRECICKCFCFFWKSFWNVIVGVVCLVVCCLVKLKKFLKCYCWCGDTCCLLFGEVEKVFEMYMLVMCVLLFVVWWSWKSFWNVYVGICKVDLIIDLYV